MNKRGISLLLEDEEVQKKPPQNVPLWHGGPAGFKETYSLPWLPILDSNTLATWCEEPTHWKRSWHWERLKAKGGGAGKGWDGWMRHQLNRHEFEQTLGDSEGQGNVVCCSPWGHKESDTLQLNNNLDSLKEFKAKKRVLARYLLAPLPWTSQLSEPWKINVFCLSHLAYGILL